MFAPAMAKAKAAAGAKEATDRPGARAIPRGRVASAPGAATPSVRAPDSTPGWDAARIPLFAPERGATPTGTPGQPLAAATRAYFEPRFGHDFASVRIHSGAAAGASAAALGARAYTVRSDIVFAPGGYRPGSADGQRLLAHELAHVVQQAGGAPRIQRQTAGSGERDEPLEAALEREQRWDDIARDAKALDEQLAPVMERLFAEQEAREAAEEPFFVKADPGLTHQKAALRAAKQRLPADLAAARTELIDAEKAFLRAEDALAALEKEEPSPAARNEALEKLVPLLAWLRELREAPRVAAEQQVAERLASIKSIQERMADERESVRMAEEYIRQMRRQLTLRGLSAARRAGATTEAPLSAEPAALGRTVTLLQTMIEASRLLAPYVTGKRAINLRTPGRFVLDAPDTFDAAKRAANIADAEPGSSVGGFYDRRRDTIHVPQSAHFGEALHEAIHKYSSVVLRNACHDLNEGFTQYVADAVLQEQGLPKAARVAYQDKVDCAAKLIREFGFDAVARLYFDGIYGIRELSEAVVKCDRYC
jgi:hypothetical protein